MEYAHSHGGARAPLPNLSSGQTYFTVESLQDITTLPRLPFSSSSFSSSAFDPLQSLPIQRGAGAWPMPYTPEVSLPASSIRTLDPRETLRGSIRDPYRQPITDREPIMVMNYVTEPIRNPIGGLQILNRAVAPTDLANQYQQWEPVHPLSPRHGFSLHRSRPNQPEFSRREHQREIPVAKDNSRAPKMPVRPGWCSLCDVDCNTKEVLYKHHVVGKKHQSMLDKLKEGVSSDGKNPQTEQPTQLMGWCSLCEVNCGTMENLHKQHVLGKKHLQVLEIRIEKETPEMDSKIENILGKRKQKTMEERNIIVCHPRNVRSCQIKDILASSKNLSDKRHTAQLKKPGNSEGHLEVDGAEARGEDRETVLGVKEVDLGAESEKDDSKESAEPIEDDGEKENVVGGKAQEAEVDGKQENVS